jgi:hypothetical protein
MEIERVTEWLKELHKCVNHLGNILGWFPAHHLRRQYACTMITRMAGAKTPPSTE